MQKGKAKGKEEKEGKERRGVREWREGEGRGIKVGARKEGKMGGDGQFSHNFGVASFPCHSKILSRSRGEKSGEGLDH